MGGTQATPNLDPIEQLSQLGGQQSSPQTSSSASTDDPLEQLAKVGQPQQKSPQQTGDITNDVGQKVIVPKDGESFADTLKRAVAYHNSLTPEQKQTALNAEAATMPKKAAQTLGAAAGIGVAGPALLAVPGEIAGAGENVLSFTESQLDTFADAYPHLAKLAEKLGYGAGATAVYKLWQAIGSSSHGH
jgi:hypothetical protein